MPYKSAQGRLPYHQMLAARKIQKQIVTEQLLASRRALKLARRIKRLSKQTGKSVEEIREELILRAEKRKERKRRERIEERLRRLSKKTGISLTKIKEEFGLRQAKRRKKASDIIEEKSKELARHLDEFGSAEKISPKKWMEYNQTMIEWINMLLRLSPMGPGRRREWKKKRAQHITILTNVQKEINLKNQKAKGA